MRRPAWVILGSGLICVGAMSRPAASQAAATPLSTADSVFARARQLVMNGNGAAGRLLVDSVIAATTPDLPSYAEALYWRAALAATSSEAERDYRRLVVEYPLSSRSDEALLQLAQLEAARGDRSAAATHLDRFLLENPTSAERGRAGLLLVRISFEQNEFQHGCVVLGRTLRDVPQAEVELRNQLEYFSPRCASVDTTKTTTTTGGAATSDSTRDSTGTSARSSAKGRYTLQVAAFKSRAEADGLAKRLKARGLDVRVAGTTKVFRVRIGRYETRAAASAAARELKTRKIDAFVTEIGAEEK